MNEVYRILFSIWQILGEMSIYLLFGFLVAGILHVIIPQKFIENHLSGSGINKAVKAALIGVPMPLCSCGVIPVAASLKRHGAGKGATISFLTSTPQTGIDSVMLTYGMLGWLFALVRVLTAFISGILCGVFTELLDKTDDNVDNITSKPSCCSTYKSKSLEVFRYGFISLPQDIGKSLIIGLVIAGLITALVPKSLFTMYLDNTWLSMVIMMLVGLPLYVCSAASVPVAAAFLNMGINPGAVLVFLITGPATNIATITTISKVISKRATVIYLSTIAITAVIAGIILNYVTTAILVNHTSAHGNMIPEWLNNISALFLLGGHIYPFSSE